MLYKWRNVISSPLAGATLTAQRAQNRWKTYHLAVSHPNTVFTARINQTFDSLDGVNQLTYDGGSGDYTDVLPGMTCWIGSSAGAFDLGMVRVRKALTTTIVYIGRISSIAFADNLYLTFVDDFQIWNKDPLVTSATIQIDGDVSFDTTGSFAPMVKVGPPVLILELTGATVSHTPTISIYSPTGQTASAYLTEAPGSSALSNATTATPTVTYNAVGEYYEAYTVTDTAGAITTVTRKIIVNPAAVIISPPTISGDIDSGGWSARVEGYSVVSLTDLHDRALCVLWKKDYKGTARDTSYGPYTNAENIRLIGWIDGQSLTINPEYGTASFTIHGPAFWLDRIQGAPMNVTDAAAVGPTSWNEMAELTTDKALYRFVHWQTTLDAITDVTFTGNDTPIQFANINSSSLKAQIDGLAGEKLLARLAFDRFGCGRIYIPQSLLDSAGKAALTVLWDCASSDWIEQLSIDRETVQSAAMVELGGTTWDGATETPVYSRAPGNIPDRYGGQQAPYSTLAIDDQDGINRIAGDMLAAQNSQYPTVDVNLYWPNDFIDFCSYIVRLSIASADNPRGITWTNKRFVPEAISFDFEPDTGAESTSITLAEETTGTPGVFYFPPQPAGVDEWKVPGFGAISLPSFFGSTWIPAIIPPPVVTDGCGVDAPLNSFNLSWDKSDISGLDEVLSSFAYFPCKIRASGSTNPTYLSLAIEYKGDASGKLHCYAIDAAKNRVLTGTVTPPGEGHNWYNTTRVDFAPISELDVAGFELALEAGGSLGEYRALDVIASATLSPGQSADLLAVGNLQLGRWYCVDGTGGPYTVPPFGGDNSAWYVYEFNSLLQGYTTGDNTFHMEGGGSNLIHQAIDAHYARLYFLTGTAGIPPCTWSLHAPFGVGSGTLGYILRNALVKSSRRVLLSTGGAFNVCGTG